MQMANPASTPQMQRELALPEGKEGGLQCVFSPQESPCKPPRSPLSPRSHSDSEATLEDRGPAGRLRPLHTAESLFLDALSLDPPSQAQVPPPSRLESEKRFPCLKEVCVCVFVRACWMTYDSVYACLIDCILLQALNEISERAEPDAYSDEEPTSGSLLRYRTSFLIGQRTTTPPSYQTLSTVKLTIRLHSFDRI